MSNPPSDVPSAAAVSPPVPKGPSPLVRTVVKLVSLSAIGALLFVFHGLSFHLTPWSQAIINGIVKYGYPKDGQTDTTVVLFREENLRALNEAYPVSYERHAEVLEALSVYGPRAVFVDFAFIDRRSPADVARLAEAICALAQVGTAVYLAAPATDSNQAHPSRITPALLQCATPVSAQMDTEQGVSGVLTYSNGVGDGPEFMATPAFSMAPPALRLDPRRAQPMEIIWGNGVAPLNEKWMGCRAAGAWWSDLVHVLRHDPLSAKLRCPYTRTISVGHLLGSSDDADVRAALEKRTVFYGAAFQLTGDRVISPVYEELPGVYLHAMAYDNLRTLGHNYKRANREMVLTSASGRRVVVSLSGLLDGLLLLVTVGVLLLVEEPFPKARRLRQRLTRTKPWLRGAALGVAALLVVLALVIRVSLWSVLLSLPLVLVAITFLDLPTAPPPHATPREFLRRRIGAIGIAALAVVLFLLVDRGLGLEAALLLVVLPGYFAYKVFVARDVLFVAMAVLLVTSALASLSPPLNLGPRNVVAYVAFFEVARHLMTHAADAAAMYFRLRAEHASAEAWGVSARALAMCDWLFTLFTRADLKEETNAGTLGHSA